MNTFFRFFQRFYASLILALAVPALVVVPATAYAASTYTDRTVVYSTSLQPINHSLSYPLAGSLHIRTSTDGIVTGFYRADYTTQFIPVTGGVNGSNVWLLIGATSPTRVTGQFENGAIVGTAFTPDHNVYRFAASNATLQ